MEGAEDTEGFSSPFRKKRRKNSNRYGGSEYNLTTRHSTNSNLYFSQSSPRLGSTMLRLSDYESSQDLPIDVDLIDGKEGYFAIGNSRDVPVSLRGLSLTNIDGSKSCDLPDMMLGARL